MGPAIDSEETVAGWIVFGAVFVVVGLGAWWTIHRLRRWSDPEWTKEQQAKAFLWSQRTGSGGIGS